MRRSTIIGILVLSLFFISTLGRREISPYENKDASDDDVYKQRAQRSAAKRAAQNRRAFGGFSDDDENDDEPRGPRSFKDDDDDEMKDTDPATRARLKALERSFKEAFTQSKDKIDKPDNQIDMDKIRELLSQDRKERGGSVSKAEEQVTVPQSNEETEKISSEDVEIPSSETISLKSSEEKISLVDL